MVPGWRARKSSDDDVFVSACGECHEPGLATATRQAREDWKGIVAEMKDRGAMLSDGDVTMVVDYLTEYFGLELNINKARAKEIAPFLRLSPAEAAAIVRVRSETGPFKSWEDLARVPGLDLKKIESKKSTVTF